MARTTFEPMRVFFADALTDPEAPTTAEITAATELTSQLPVDGIQFAGTQNNASQAMLGDAFVTEEPGTWGVSASLTFVRDSDDDIAEGLFTYRTQGYLIVFTYGGTIVDGNLVDVYEVTSHNPVPLASAENEYQKVQVQLAITATPNFRATIGGES